LAFSTFSPRCYETSNHILSGLYPLENFLEFEQEFYTDFMLSPYIKQTF